MNIAIVVGRLAHTPELKALPSGQKVANCSIATNYVYKKDNGEKVEGTDWHNITAYGKTAETMAQWLKGGDQVIVHGSMKTRSWDDKDGGAKRYRTEIVVDRFEFGAKNMKRDDRNGSQSDDDKFNQFGKTDADATDTIEYPEEDINLEDIPF